MLVVSFSQTDRSGADVGEVEENEFTNKCHDDYAFTYT